MHTRRAGLRLTKETLLLLLSSTYIMNRQASLFLFGSGLLDCDPPGTMTCTVIMVCVASSLPHPASSFLSGQQLYELIRPFKTAARQRKHASAETHLVKELQVLSHT